MSRNIQNQNSVALILADLNIGLVATGSAVAHDLRLRDRLLDLPMEEFPGRPMLGKRPADPQPDTKRKRTYPGGGVTADADTLRAAEAASATTSEPGQSAMCSQRIHPRIAQTQQQRHQSWQCSRVSKSSERSGDVAVPVGCQVLVSS
jgi:hypothetical protein